MNKKYVARTSTEGKTNSSQDYKYAISMSGTSRNVEYATPMTQNATIDQDKDACMELGSWHSRHEILVNYIAIH